MTLLKVARAAAIDSLAMPCAGGECRGGRGVERVVLAGELHFEFGPRRAGAKNLPVHSAVFVAQIADAASWRLR